MNVVSFVLATACFNGIEIQDNEVSLIFFSVLS